MDTVKTSIKEVITDMIYGQLDSILYDLDSNEFKETLIDQLWNEGIELERDYWIKPDRAILPTGIDESLNKLAEGMAEYYINNRIETK